MIREIAPTKVWRWALIAYTIGLVGGTTAVGFVFGWVGSSLQTTVLFNVGSHLWVGFLATIAFVYGLHELRIVRLPMPQIHWQVPATWSSFGKIGQGILYGAVLGAEIFTLIPFATFYVILLFEASLGVKDGIVLGFVYGLARVLPTLVTTIYARSERQDVNALADRVTLRIPLLHMVNGLTLLIIGGLLIGILLFV